ncbi:hypothetical protein K0M31_019447 [Melipona bicolor]|uniref:Uncharacterized protein n=1 Tax=Melipona bicolor TaxID=60889 RepID=A0AA40KR69_9HYME|nr:hypothetical protein K0M31_019447 [Melipona bicolor]
MYTVTTRTYIELTTRVRPDRGGLGHEWASGKRDEREKNDDDDDDEEEEEEEEEEEP